MSTSNPTQSQRRIKYGLNVAIAVIAAMAIVVIVNVIAYKRLFKVRWDFTATRQYSLSPQTQRVLAELKGEYQLVTLFQDYGNQPLLQTRIDRTRDLIEEYGHGGGKVQVEHINPSRNVARVEKFYGTLKDRYSSALEPVQKAVKQGTDALDQLQQRVKAQLDTLKPLLDDKTFADGRLKEFTHSVAQALLRFDSQFDDIKKQVSQGLDGPLPNYATGLETLRVLLGDFDQKVFAVAAERLEQAGSASIPNDVKERLLQLAEQFKQTRQMLEPVIAALREANPPAEYTQLRDQLAAGDSVVLVGAKQVQVVALTDMFREPSPQERQAMEQGEQPEVRFLGEERLTGALVNMELTRKPMVVFISTGQRPAIGMGGAYEAVAQRLRNMSFDVRDWNPSGRGNPMTGQMMPPGPPPEPAEGQKVVWVVLPVQDENPMMMMQMGGGAGQQVAMHVGQRLDAGDAAMFIVGLSQTTMMGMPDPMAELLRPWGISPMLDRLVLREVSLPNRRKAPTTGHTIESWAKDVPITEALGGMPGVFVQASPLELGGGGEAGKGAKATALVTLTGAELWAERDLRAEPAPSPEERAEKFVIAAVAEKEGQRLAVFADPAWASDEYTTRGPFGPGTAEMFGAQFPANAELFVNSVYWLAGMDQLIAASARTQDIRRVAAMEEGRLLALRWTLLLGLPALCAAAGVGVWFVRRRGG